MRLLRRRRSSTGKNASRKRQDGSAAWGTDGSVSRYTHIPENSRRQGAAFDMPPAPERGEVLERVCQLTKSLEGGIDEATGAALDLLIESWVARWIATVEADYVNHCAAISAHRGQAVRWLTESTLIARHENEELGHIGDAYSTCRRDLADEQAERAISGRSRTRSAAAILLVLAGAFTVTVAFRNTLTLALPPQSGVLAWLLAAGTTSMAMVAAASAGISLAIRQQIGHWSSKLATASVAVTWISLGLATILIPLLATGAHSAPLSALFFGAVYPINGASTMFQSEKLYNPKYFTYRRLAKQYSMQVQKAAEAEANLNQARSALNHHDSELGREDHRRLAAIADRKALGAEAANYARILMAAMLRDPAMTGLTETGPVPEPMPAVASKAYEAAGQEPDFDPDEARKEMPDHIRTSVDPTAAPAITAAPLRQQGQPLRGENCTVFLTDVVAFGSRSRTDRDRLIIREALSSMMGPALRDIPGTWSEDRGDGILTVVPPSISTARVMDQLLNQLPAALKKHNDTQRDSARFQLRLAVNVGPVVRETMGVSGQAIIVAARLVEAPNFKEAIARSAASLGVIVSPFVYENVIKHSPDASDEASYSPVLVEVKESSTIAWMKLFHAESRDTGDPNDAAALTVPERAGRGTRVARGQAPDELSGIMAYYL